MLEYLAVRTLVKGVGMLKLVVIGLAIYGGLLFVSKIVSSVVTYFVDRATKKIFWYVLYYLYQNSSRQVTTQELYENIGGSKLILSLCMAKMRIDDYVEVRNEFDSQGETFLFKISAKGKEIFKAFIPQLIAAGWSQKLKEM